MKRHLSTDIWIPFSKLRKSHYEKRWTNTNDDYEHQADERAVEDDETQDLLANERD